VAVVLVAVVVRVAAVIVVGRETVVGRPDQKVPSLEVSVSACGAADRGFDPKK
jgi:hypothetical protein